MARKPKKVEKLPDQHFAEVKAARRLLASTRSHPRDPFTTCVAEFHEFFGVKNPKEPEFPPKMKQAHLDFREVISCMREVAVIAREKSKAHGGKDILLQRAQLMTEEMYELLEAMARRDEAHTCAEASDMIYVVSGTLLQLGLGRFLFPVFNEVHAANMSKLDPTTGEPFYDDSGKITKGPYYQKPNLRRVMNEARELAKLSFPIAGPSPALAHAGPLDRAAGCCGGSGAGGDSPRPRRSKKPRS